MMTAHCAMLATLVSWCETLLYWLWNLCPESKTATCPYNVKNQPLAAPALSKQLPNQEKLFPAVAETFQQSINH